MGTAVSGPWVCDLGGIVYFMVLIVFIVRPSVECDRVLFFSSGWAPSAL